MARLTQPFTQRFFQLGTILTGAALITLLLIQLMIAITRSPPKPVAQETERFEVMIDQQELQPTTARRQLPTMQETVKTPEPPKPLPEPTPPATSPQRLLEEIAMDAPEFEITPFDIALDPPSINLDNLIVANQAPPTATRLTELTHGYTGQETHGAELGQASQNQEVLPLVRIEPIYPRSALLKGIEGWVQLGFTITETGAVSNIKIIHSQPVRVFDKEARRALARWKYQPKIVDGQAVKQPDMEVKLWFELSGQRTAGL